LIAISATVVGKTLAMNAKYADAVRADADVMIFILQILMAKI